MDTPQGPEAQVGEQVAGGAHSRRLADVKAGLRVDTQQLNQLKQSLKEARDITRDWRLEMEKLAVAAAKVNGSVSGVGGGAAGTPRPAGTDGQPITSSEQPGTQPSATAAATRGGLARIGGAMAAFAPIVGSAMGQLDARIDRGIAYATSADRLSMLTQQMTGMSQMQVMEQRQSLEKYRLGMGGMNEMISFQAQTGIQATASMGRSIDAIRASTGFTKTTADILNEQRQLMNPEVANRMFFMGGVNAFNIGGGMKDPLQMRQEVVQRMGLDNPMIARSALMPGSVTRARLADMGIGEEMQTEFIQYGQQQATFKEKGGMGFYDPSKASHQKLMGIDNNLASQQEETERVTVAREEQFMRRQIDNMASLEKSNQALIEAMASLEDTMSGLIGGRISSRPLQKSIGGAVSGIGMGLLTAGAVTGFSPTGWGMMAAGGAMMLGAALAGDPENPEAEGKSSGGVPKAKSRSSANDNSIMVPYGYNGNRISLSELKNKPDFQSLKPRFRERLIQMMRVNPNVGIGGGSRDSGAQERMFLSRYQRTNEETNIFWNGSYWKHVSGAAAAPPGRSMHEIGLAADLVGDLDWMNAHASEFGLQHFAGVNNEPWHVQPDDLPRSRSEYEKQGAPWGTDGGYNPTEVSKSAEADTGGDHGGGSSGQPSGVGAGNIPSLNGMSIQDAMAASRQNSLTRLLSSGGSGWGSPRTNGGVNLSKKSGSAPLPPPAPGALAGSEVARLAYNAGFRGKDLAAVVAISHRESRWKPGAYNPNRATKDDSYGLMQINMLGDLGPARLQQFGISKYEDLYDPQTNMNAAYVLYQRSNNTLHPWGGYKGKSNTYSTDMSLGEQAVREAGLEKELSGDPTAFLRAPSRRSSSGGSTSNTTHITSAPTINVAPVINFNGTPSTPDLRGIAQTVSRLIKEEVDMLDMRTS
jgi:hypothetical protein